MTRQLAKIVKLDNVLPHPNADRLKIAVIGLWEIATNLDVKKGDEVVFFEIDSMLPLEDKRFSFLAGRNEKMVKGIKYSRLRTMRLRKHLSQGLICPIELFDKEIQEFALGSQKKDLQDLLGVIKYKPKFTKSNSTPNGGSTFPSFIPQTSQDRIQNIVRQYQDAYSDNELFEESFKLHGCSTTIYVKDNNFGVCSRTVNIHFKEDWNEINNLWIRTAIDTGFLFKIILHCQNNKVNLAFQGELVGESLFDNFEGIKGHTIYFFDIYDIDNKRYLSPSERIALLGVIGLNTVPIHNFTMTLPESPKELLSLADGESGLNGKFREGFVYKSHSRDFSFKVVSNQFLERTGE